MLLYGFNDIIIAVFHVDSVSPNVYNTYSTRGATFCSQKNWMYSIACKSRRETVGRWREGLFLLLSLGLLRS